MEVRHVSIRKIASLSQTVLLDSWFKYGLARGSVEHSDFASRVLKRGIETGRYMTVAVYGTYEEKAAITDLLE